MQKGSERRAKEERPRLQDKRERQGWIHTWRSKPEAAAAAPAAGHLKDPSSKASRTGGNFQAGLKFQSPPPSTHNPPTPQPRLQLVVQDVPGRFVQASWAEITVNTRQRCTSRRGPGPGRPAVSSEVGFLQQRQPPSAFQTQNPGLQMDKIRRSGSANQSAG